MTGHQDLTGRIALVTGGAKNIGRAIATVLAERGAHVLINYFHSHEQAKRTQEELRERGARVDLLRASVARPEQVDRMFEEIDRRYGSLDILVNNAANGALVPLDELTDEHLDKALDTNLKGGLRCARAAAPLMERAGGGSIVNLSALGSSRLVMANYLACAPAKAAVEAVTRHLAVEYAPKNIRVNTASAAMLTSEVADAFPDAEAMRNAIVSATPLGRLGTPEEFAEVVAFLASDRAAWITGQTILADGGLSLGAPLLSPPRPRTDPAPAAPVPAGGVDAPPERTGARLPEDVPNPPEAGTEDTAGTTGTAGTAGTAGTTGTAGTVDTDEIDEIDDTEDIAVVGMGLAVAGASTPEEFWQLRTTGRELFTEVPEDRWERSGFSSPDRADEDKSYQDTCVFITDFAPEPGALEGLSADPGDTELTTLWLRHSLVQALDGVRRTPSDRFSFHVGYTADGSQHLEEAGVLATASRLAARAVGELKVSEPERLLAGMDRVLSARYHRGAAPAPRFLPHQVGREAMAGVLPDGTEVQMVDTACSSSLYAIDIGIKGLLSGRQDIAVCGGAFGLAPRGTVLFSKLKGLSEQGRVRALDAGADGVIFADGAGVVVLKRLSRARADGDRVLGVLKAFGSSSDGKGKAIYAPSSQGQSLAVERALKAGGLTGDAVDWVNAHATGTPAGDLAEFSTLRRHYGVGRTTSVTSSKSLIGHTGWAAGVVSLIESVLALQHETIPGQYRFDRAPEAFELGTTGLEISAERRSWPAVPGRCRTAAISGFGFGGTNAHLIVAEPGTDRDPAHERAEAAATTEEAEVRPRTETESPAQAPAEPGNDRSAGAGAAGATAAGAATASVTTPAGDPAPRPQAPGRRAAAERIAVVGWSAKLPGADTAEDVGAWLTGARDLPSGFGDTYPAPPFQQVRMPPATVRTIDRCQLMILQCAHALRDQLPEFWQEHAARTGVVIGHMGPTRAAMLYAARCYLDDIERALRADPGVAAEPGLTAVLGRLREQVRALVPPSTEDSFPGMMPNVISARVANYFDLHGPNITVDAGLASALSAFATAARYLRGGELDFVLAGGINGNSLPEYRRLLTEVFGPTPPELAEGAFLFGLTTESRARRAGLTVLGYVDETPPAGGRPGGADRVVDCGPDGDYSRYLGAAGGAEILRALGLAGTTTELRCHEPGSGATDGLLVSGAGTPAPERPEDGDLVRRYVPALRAEPGEPDGPPPAAVPDGAVLLTDVPEAVRRFAGAATGITVLSTRAFEGEQAGWRHVEPTPESVRAALAGVGGPVRHLLVVTDLTTTAPPATALTSDASPVTALHDLAFLALKERGEELDTPAASVVFALLGAAPGGVTHPFAGLFTGLAKCVALELERADCFALVAATRDPGQGAGLVARERVTRRVFPVVHHDGDRRLVPALDVRRPDDPAGPGPARAPDGTHPAHPGQAGPGPAVAAADARRPGTPPPAGEADTTGPPGTAATTALGHDPVVVALGGARGITAELLVALTARHGGHIHLLGSNPLDDYPADVFAGTDEEFAAGRAAYISAQLKAGGGTVAAISRRYDRMADARAARRNLTRIAGGAAGVTYHTCDARDEGSVRAAIDAVTAEHGRVDLVINAPGLNRSALIRDKDFDEFRRIRDLKVEAHRNLHRALSGRPPRLWCDFGSLLGYFGQRGEADYASGNDYLATAAGYAAATTGTEEFVIGWTLWDEVGMGAGELTREYFRKAGSYSHMPVAEGIRHFLAELSAAPRAPLTVHLGDAERVTVERFHPGFLDRPPAPAPADGRGRFYLRRALDTPPGEEGTTARFECRFDLATDAYLDHHLVRGVPTLPGTFVTEIAAEAALALVPGGSVAAFEDVRFLHFLQVRPGVPQRPKRITARVVERAGDLTTVAVDITHDVVSPSGVLLVADRPHFTTRVLVSSRFPDAPKWAGWDREAEVPVTDPYHAQSAPVLLTGPFRVTGDTVRHPEGARSVFRARLSDDRPWPPFLMPTLLLDAMARTGVLDPVDGLVPVAAPLSIRRIDLYQQADDRELTEAHGHLDLYVTNPGFRATGADETPENRFVAVAPGGHVVAQMKGLDAVVIGLLDPVTGVVHEPGTLPAGGGTR
ncbi:SDR family oxidoreductase [Streptomyces sp. NPDC047974]|uniref:SDR family oxidoreductase n=1 Tax=Streptomyces sp. NPDC047974 TaxID=3154343 RepID=UPI0033FA2D72